MLTTLSSGDTAWMLISSALVMFMLPGLALFYGGMVRRKNVLSTLMYSFIALLIIGIEWVAVGYSMAFSSGNWFIGGLQNAFLVGINIDSLTGTIPTLVFVLYQGMFAVITPALISGAIAERISFKAYMLFILLWGLCVYNPICHWVWGGGFLTGRALDFAGGTVVHISSGISALVLIYFLGKRRGYKEDVILPHNLVLTLLGTGILWFGWFGFNAGSALAANGLAGLAWANTFIAPCAAGLCWMLFEWIHTGKPTALGVASGIVAGLVAITPAAGFVTPGTSIIIGIIAGIVCFTAVVIKARNSYDDTLDVFGVHGIGGITGALLTGVFASVNSTGLIGGNITQFYAQLEAVLATISYAVIVTIIICLILKYTVGLRVDASEENMGLDMSQHGEKGYN